MFPPRTTGWIYSQAVPGFFFTGGYCCQGPATAYHTFCGNKLGGLPMQTTQRWDGGAWATRTDCPLPARYSHTTCNTSRVAVTTGGFSSVAPFVLRDVDEYANETWRNTTDCPMPPRANLASGSVADQAFIIGGEDDAGNTLNTNDGLVDDTWSSRMNLPSPNRRFCVATDGGSSIYVNCGVNSSFQLLTDNDRFDPDLDVWVQRTDCPFPARQGAGCFRLGTKLFVIGGGTPTLNDVDSYFFDADTWAASTDLPAPARHRFGAASTAARDLGWVTAGQNGSGVRIADHDEYGGQAWVSRIDLPFDVRMLNAAGVA